MKRVRERVCECVREWVHGHERELESARASNEKRGKLTAIRLVSRGRESCQPHVAQYPRRSSARLRTTCLQRGLRPAPNNCIGVGILFRISSLPCPAHPQGPRVCLYGAAFKRRGLLETTCKVVTLCRCVGEISFEPTNNGALLRRGARRPPAPPRRPRTAAGSAGAAGWRRPPAQARVRGKLHTAISSRPGEWESGLERVRVAFCGREWAETGGWAGMGYVGWRGLM